MKDNKNEQESFGDLKINMSVLQKFFSSVPNGLAFCKLIIDDNNRPIDYVFIEANDSFESLTGLKRAAILNRRVTQVLPGIQSDPSDWIGKYGKVAITGVGAIFEDYSTQLDKWYRVIATCPEKGFFLSIFEDISDCKRLEKENESLIVELSKAHDELEHRVKERTKELEIKSKNLEELNTALGVLLKKRQEDKAVLEDNVLANLKGMIEPYFKKIKKTKMDEKQKVLLSIIESNLREITLPFASKLSSKYINLTPTEIKIAEFVKHGKRNKEIAELLNLSIRTIESHRESIRKKLGITNRKANLRSYLLSLR